METIGTLGHKQEDDEVAFGLTALTRLCDSPLNLLLKKEALTLIKGC